MAIAHAHRILNWQENLASDEMPPDWMWPYEDLLEGWFKEVDNKRRDRYGVERDDDEDLDGPVMENELAAAMRNGK